MRYSHLFILVEGSDDKRFFERIIVPLIDSKGIYTKITCHPYSGWTKKEKEKFLKSIAKQENRDYLYVKDFDDNTCYTKIKEKILNSFPGIVEKSKIFISKREIESWYCAGMNAQRFRVKSLQTLKSTDEVTKEIFENAVVMGNTKISIKEYMMDILTDFNFEQAKQRNSSFNYFVTKLSL